MIVPDFIIRIIKPQILIFAHDSFIKVIGNAGRMNQKLSHGNILVDMMQFHIKKLAYGIVKS